MVYSRMFLFPCYNDKTRIKKMKKLGCPGTKRETPTEQRDESNKYRGVDTTQWYVNLSYEISEL